MQDAWIPLVTDLLAKECIVLCGLLQKGKTRGQREGHQSQEWAVLVILEHHFHQLLVRACWGLWISDQQFPKIKDFCQICNLSVQRTKGLPWNKWNLKVFCCPFTTGQISKALTLICVLDSPLYEKAAHPFIQVDDAQVWLTVGKSRVWGMLALPCTVGESFLNQLVPNTGSL